jgi:hypothetical protein
MKTLHWQRWGSLLSLALAAVLAPLPAHAIFEFIWSVEGHPPSTIDDLHLHFQIQETPFTFGKVLFDDIGNFAPPSSPTPGPDGKFDLNFDGASPIYGTADNVKVKFNFRSDKDVKVVNGEWTLGGHIVATFQSNLITREVRDLGNIPEPSTLALFALGVAALGRTAMRRAPPA